MILGIPRAKLGLCHYDIWGGGDPHLIRYSSKTAEQNFMKLSGIVHYMMPYCTSYFKFLFWMILGFSRAKQGLCHTKLGGVGGIILWASLTVFLVLIGMWGVPACECRILSLMYLPVCACSSGKWFTEAQIFKCGLYTCTGNLPVCGCQWWIQNFQNLLYNQN